MKEDEAYSEKSLIVSHLWNTEVSHTIDTGKHKWGKRQEFPLLF